MVIALKSEGSPTGKSYNGGLEDKYEQLQMDFSSLQECLEEKDRLLRHLEETYQDKEKE